MAILKTEKLTKIYTTGEHTTTALDNVSIEIEGGSFTAVVGASGSGKTTLLHLMGGLEHPTSGKVWINNTDITTMSDEELTLFRRAKIGIVFQRYNLIPMLNVKDNICLPIMLAGHKTDDEYFSELISVLGIKEKMSALPFNLSGGQQQRVAIARALITKPSIVLADEPTGNLDSRNGKEVISLLKESASLFNQTIVMITHDESIAKTCNRIIKISDGKVV